VSNRIGVVAQRSVNDFIMIYWQTQW